MSREFGATRFMAAPNSFVGEVWGHVMRAGQAFISTGSSHPQVKRNSTPPLSLFGQLLWREFFYTAATNNPRFDRMEGNPICIQIPWDRNPEALAKWAEGKTGFPWIDAIMTQLRQEGWIHHLARHAVACFLTRGDLWVSWESGVRVSVSPWSPAKGSPLWAGGWGGIPGSRISPPRLPAEGLWLFSMGHVVAWREPWQSVPRSAEVPPAPSRCLMSCSWTQTSA